MVSRSRTADAPTPRVNPPHAKAPVGGERAVGDRPVADRAYNIRVQSSLTTDLWRARGRVVIFRFPVLCLLAAVF